MANETFDARSTGEVPQGVSVTAEGAWTADGAAALADAIYDRWREAVGAERQRESEWLVEVSHSLQRTSRVLGPAEHIG